MSTGLLTVLAGYCSGPTIPRSTQLWVEALRRHSQQLVLVFDNPEPADLPASWSGPDLRLQFGRHGGYDFGSYRRGLELAREQGLLERASHVLLCNDSVLGPLGDLAPLLQRMQARNDEAWGLTASHQQTPHLQSFFVLLGRSLLERPALQQFFASIEPLASRHAVIQRYELGLSRALLAAGAPLRAWVEPQQLLDPRSGQPAGNPTAFPLSLVELGVPLIKARALRERSANQEGIATSCRLIAERNPELWRALWEETASRRFWQQQLSIGVLLEAEDSTRLPERLQWLDQQAQPGLQLWLPVASDARQRLARIRHEQAEALASGRLQLVPTTAVEPPLQELLAACDQDWVVLAAAPLWEQRLRISLQARQLAEQPSLNHSSGPPRLWRRQWLLGQPGQSLHNLTAVTG